ncbi:hypothetical protein GCM10020358_22540 [Amorphoplanes nipponensis]
MRLPERRAVDVQVDGGLPGDGEAQLAGRAQQLLQRGAVIAAQRRRNDLARALAFPALRRRQGDRGAGDVVEAVHVAVPFDPAAPELGRRVQGRPERAARVAVRREQAQQARVVAEDAEPARRGGRARVEAGQQGDVVDQRAQQRATGPAYLETLGQVQEPAQARDQGRFAVVVPHRVDPAAAAAGQVPRESPPAAARRGHQLDLESRTPVQRGGHGLNGRVSPARRRLPPSTFAAYGSVSFHSLASLTASS